MADWLDEALDLSERERDASIARARAAIGAWPPAPPSVLCETCDAEIPLERRSVNPYATRCIPCQEQAETREAARRPRRLRR